MRPYVLRDDEHTRRERATEIRAFRIRHGFTQKQLAELIQVSRGTIINAEAARHCMQPDLLGKFQRFRQRHEYERQRVELELVDQERLIVAKREAIRQGQKPPSRWD